MPFRVAANAALAPDLIRAAMQGQVNNIAFRFAQPGRDRPRRRRLAAARRSRSRSPQGRVRLAGRWGDGLVIQSRLDGFDLSMLNAFSPGLGLGGRATGSLDFAQPADGSLPARRGAAQHRRLHPHRHRRPLARRSTSPWPAACGPRAARLAAVIRRGGGVIGRAAGAAAAARPGRRARWTTRLLAAPLAGGIRYNGPADVPMSFANLPGHQLTGPIGIAADFSGRVQSPQFTGVVRANNLTYRQRDLRHADHQPRRRRPLHALASSRSSSSPAAPATARSPAAARIGLASAAGFPIDLRLKFQNAQLARSDDIGATATGNARDRQQPPSGALISGELELGEVRYQIVRQAAAEVPQLAGVRRQGEPLPRRRTSRAPTRGVPSIWRLDLRLRADNRVFVSGMGLESEWRRGPARRRARPRRPRSSARSS